MGKAKRFNAYDSSVDQKRKLVQEYGQARQKLSVGSTFRSAPLSPPIAFAAAADASSSTGTFITASLSADQTTNINATDHIEFDTVDEDGGITLQTGAGQADGIFELKANKTYLLIAGYRAEFTDATGNLNSAWYDITNAANLGSESKNRPLNNAASRSNQPINAITVKPTTDITVELRIISEIVLTIIHSEEAFATITEIGGGDGSGGTVSFPIRPTVTEITSPTSTQDLDLNTASGHVFRITADKDFTLTFSNAPADLTQHSFEIELTNDSTSVARTVTLPSSVRQLSSITVPGTTPVSRGVYVLRVNDGGTAYDIVQAVTGTASADFALTDLSNIASTLLGADLNMNGNSINLANDVIALSWANVAADGFLQLKTDSGDFFDFTESNNGPVSLKIRSQHASEPDNTLTITQLSGLTGAGQFFAPNQMSFLGSGSVDVFNYDENRIVTNVNINPDADGTINLGNSVSLRYLAMHAASFKFDSSRSLNFNTGGGGIVVDGSGDSFTLSVDSVTKLTSSATLTTLAGNVNVTGTLDALDTTVVGDLSLTGTEIRFIGGAVPERVDTFYERTDASPSDDDIINTTSYIGDNSIGNPIVWATQTVRQRDVTSGTEDAEFKWSVADAGAIVLSELTFGNNQLTVQSDDRTDLVLLRNESTPATGDVGEIRIQTQDSASNITDFFSISVVANTITNGSEDSDVTFFAENGGTNADFLRYIGGTGLTILDSGSDKLGFYAQTPTIQQTGVAVTASAIHAALVTLGLITA